METYLFDFIKILFVRLREFRNERKKQTFFQKRYITGKIITKM